MRRQADEGRSAAVDEAFETALPLDMGQLLSVPAVLLGLWLLGAAYRRTHHPTT